MLVPFWPCAPYLSFFIHWWALLVTFLWGGYSPSLIGYVPFLCVGFASQTLTAPAIVSFWSNVACNFVYSMRAAILFTSLVSRWGDFHSGPVWLIWSQRGGSDTLTHSGDVFKALYLWVYSFVMPCLIMWRVLLEHYITLLSASRSRWSNLRLPILPSPNTLPSCLHRRLSFSQAMILGLVVSFPVLATLGCCTHVVFVVISIVRCF